MAEAAAVASEEKSAARVDYAKLPVRLIALAKIAAVTDVVGSAGSASADKNAPRAEHAQHHANLNVMAKCAAMMDAERRAEHAARAKPVTTACVKVEPYLRDAAM